MNRKQKRELRKKRHARQKYLKNIGSSIRMEAALLRLNSEPCPAVRDGVRCHVTVSHNVHRGTNSNGFPVVWRDSERA